MYLGSQVKAGRSDHVVCQQQEKVCFFVARVFEIVYVGQEIKMDKTV